MGHLACHQVIFLIFLRGLDLSLAVQHVAPTFLGCWVLIISMLVFRFQHDDHLIFLDVVAHVKTDIYPFKITLWDIRAMLLKVI
jgi:hypothetical protein